MSLLSQPDALPSGFRMLCKYLHWTGAPVPETELVRAVSPPALNEGRMQDRTQSMLREAIALGLVIRSEDGEVTLANAVSGVGNDSRDSQTAFRRYLRKLIMDSDDDLNAVLAWLFLQDLFAFSGLTFDQASRLNPERRGRAGVLNDVSWKNLERWVVWLGLGWTYSEGLVPDPSFALREEAAALFSDDPRAALSIGAFLDRVSEVLPVLDRGSVFSAIRAEYDPAGSAEHLSPAMSLALLGLQAEGVLALEQRSDAAELARVRASSTDTLPVTHVVLSLDNVRKEKP